MGDYWSVFGEHCLLNRIVFFLSIFLSKLCFTRSYISDIEQCLHGFCCILCLCKLTLKSRWYWLKSPKTKPFWSQSNQLSLIEVKKMWNVVPPNAKILFAKLIVNLCDFTHCKNLSSVKMCPVYTNRCIICWSSQVFNKRSPNLEPQFNFDHSTRNILDKRGWSQWANREKWLKIKLRRNQPPRIRVTR